MYAIVETGGKQYRVEPGNVIKVEKITAEPGEKVTLERVLMVGADDGARFGTPVVAGASVEATVVANGKARKVIVFKYKNKTKYRRFNGHRQPYTELKIEAING